jgi:nitroreductase
MTLPETMERILDLARWAPSGDNTQPWRFEVIDEFNVVVHGFDTRDHCVYDLDGHPSQISIGALLETMRIAASALGLAMTARRQESMPDSRPTIDVRFEPDPAVTPDPLAGFVTRRAVQRRAMSTRALTADEKQALQAAAGPAYRVLWIEGFAAKLRFTRLLFSYAGLRLTMPEAYEVHRSVIEWNASYSEDRMPDQALGVDATTLRVMRFVMASWSRVKFFNTFLAGTWAPRLQMDLLPGLACAGHFVIEAQAAPRTIDDYLDAGRAAQRFWLTATRLGLNLQPEMAPLIFARYVRESRPFSSAPGMDVRAQRLAGRLAAQLGEHNTSFAVFMGRVGAGAAARARSTRRPLSSLLVRPGPQAVVEESYKLHAQARAVSGPRM